MKKFLALLTAAAMILTVASCSNGSTETTTTPAETTEAPGETTPAETTPEETTPEETEAPDEPEESEAPAESENPETPAENADSMEIVRANAPIYAAFLEEQTVLPVYVGFAYEADLYGTGVASACNVNVAIKSSEEMAVISAADGTEQRIIIGKDRYYIVSPAEKAAIYMDVNDEMRASLQESMTAGLANNVQFDAAAATYETGTEEYNGTEYLFEKIDAPEAKITIYADPGTKAIRYLISDDIAMEVTALHHDVSDELFTIPEDYTLVSMEDAMGAQ